MTGVIADSSSQLLRFGPGVRVERLRRRLARRVVLASAVLFAIGLLFSAVAHADVYWSNYGSGGGGIGHASSAGTGVNQNFISAPDSDGAGPLKVAVGDGYIFWVDLQAGTIGRANINGTGVDQDFITTGGNNDLYGLAVGGNYLYFAYFAGIAGTGTGTSIARVNINGSGLDYDFIPLDTGVTPYGIAVNANYIYWEEEEYQGPNLQETIARANLNGSGVNNDFISDAGTQGGVAVNADYIYYSVENDIGRANLDGSDPDTDFITTSGEEDVAVDPDYIYWASDGSTIGRANLDGTDVDDSFIAGGHQTTGVAAGGASSYEISGTVNNSCGCGGVPGTTILVQGKTSDGTEVDESAVTDGDGGWSVMVPNGSYVAGPTFDGESIDGEGFDPEQSPPITVNNADYPGVDFATCAGPSDEDAGVISSRLAWDRGQLAGASDASTDQCEASYGFKIWASIPQKWFVDPSPRAPYAPHADGSGYRADNQESGRWRGKLPGCPRFASDDSHPPALKWSSYYLGTGGPSTSIGFTDASLTLNGSSGLVSSGGSQVYPAKLTRVFNYLEDGHERSCEVPMRIVPEVSVRTQIPEPDYKQGANSSFQIVVSWDLPFTPEGYITGDDKIPKVSFIATKLHEYVHEQAEKIRLFEEIPDALGQKTGKAVQAAIVYVVTEQIEGVIGKIATHAGKWPSAETIGEMLEKVITGEKLWNFGIAGAASFIASELHAAGGYGTMTIVIRGELERDQCPPAYYPGHHPSLYRHCQDTTLAFDTTTSHFPNYHLIVYRHTRTEVSTVTNLTPAQNVVVETGPRATTLPEVYNSLDPADPTYKIDASRGFERNMNTLWHAMGSLTPDAAAADAGATDFTGQPAAAPFCTTPALTAGTPYTRCYTWLDTSP